MPSSAELRQIRDTLAAAVERKNFRRMDFFVPYPKQAQFLAMGLVKSERLLSAGNQNGKTITGAYEASVHATGQYPPWWTGRRWDRPTKGWVCAESSKDCRDTPQKYLCGEPGVQELFGTGMIPRSAFVGEPSTARGVADAYDTLQVRHASGGISIIRFKSYEQGRAKFQSDTLDWTWCDEEPPLDVYSEIITRLTATQGSAWITFTPLKGMSDVVMMFFRSPAEHRGLVQMTIEDAEHIPPEERARIIAAWPAHEREARALGIPMLGSGRIFQVPEAMIREPMIETLPRSWPLLWSIDFGIDHPFAAVLTAWDRDNDVGHIIHAIRMSDGRPRDHAAAMKPIGVNVPVAWPQDGTRRQTDGQVVSKLYKAEGLQMLAEHATWPNGGYDTEAGVMEMNDRFTTGRLKVAEHLMEWFEEYRMYHRKDGLIVKERDDLMSATRVWCMAKRYSRLTPLGGQAYGKRPAQIARGTDFDVF